MLAKGVGAVGVPVNDGDAIVALNNISAVFAVILAVFAAINVGKVVIVVELTPPTLFTVGNAAVPPKSFVSCIIPFEPDVASLADIVPDAIVIPAPSVKAPCFEFNISYSALLNNPAVVPDTDADGIFNVIVGVVVPFATVEVKVFPVVVKIIGFTFVTVPTPPVPPTTSILIDPFPLVIVTPFPAVRVDLVKVFPLELPINN